jgi:hypothetical protein
VSYQDVLGTYSTPVGGGVISAVDATNNTAHFDANINQGRFCKLMMRSRAKQRRSDGDRVPVTRRIAQ